MIAPSLVPPEVFFGSLAVAVTVAVVGVIVTDAAVAASVIICKVAAALRLFIAVLAVLPSAEVKPLIL